MGGLVAPSQRWQNWAVLTSHLTLHAPLGEISTKGEPHTQFLVLTLHSFCITSPRS